MIDTNKILYGSMFSGFSSNNKVNFSVVYGGGTLAPGGYIGPIRASAPLLNTNNISQVQIQFAGIETFYRQIFGVLSVNYPNNSSPTYQIESMSYYSNGNLYVDTYISNQTGSNVNVPAITFNCSAETFIPPF